MQSSGTAMTDLPDLCREAPADSGGVAAPGGITSNDKKRSSSTYAADWSSKSLRASSVDVEDKSSLEGRADEQCGWGPVQPHCCRVFRNTKVILFFLCCLATIQVSECVWGLTPSTPAVPNYCCSKGPASYWSNPPFLIFDIRALWRSVLSARAPECQKLKMVG